MINEDTPTIEQKESIKLIKNRKGYNWEIRILDLDISKMQKLDEEMREKFGNGLTSKDIDMINNEDEDN